MDVNPDKPGQLTTEFWTNLLTQVVSAVVAIAALFGHQLDGSALQPLIGMGAIVAMGISAAYYSHSRGTVKAAKANATATVTAAIQAMTPTPIPSATAPADPGVDPEDDGPLTSVDPGSEEAESMAQMGTAA